MRRPTTRELVLAGAGLVGAATAATSAVSLYGIAVKCGIPEPWAAANPIALDAGAGVAALAWITEQGERRRWGRLAAIGALVASLAENGIDHAISSGLLEVQLWLVLAVSGCIPAMLFACVHLAALMARTQPAVKVAPKSRPRRGDSRTPAVAAPTEQPKAPLHEVGKPPSMSARVRAWLTDEYEAGRTPTGADADKHFELEGSARCGARALVHVLADRDRKAM